MFIGAGIAVVIIAVALFVLSFFLQDRFEKIESDIEQLAVSTTQETYQLQNKVKQLEEELLTDDYETTDYY